MCVDVLIDEAQHTVTLTRGPNTNRTAQFTYDRPAGDVMSLDGAMDGKKICMRLRLVDRNRFLLVNRAFTGCRSIRSTGEGVADSGLGIRDSGLVSGSGLSVAFAF